LACRLIAHPQSQYTSKFADRWARLGFILPFVSQRLAESNRLFVNPVRPLTHYTFFANFLCHSTTPTDQLPLPTPFFPSFF